MLGGVGDVLLGLGGGGPRGIEGKEPEKPDLERAFRPAGEESFPLHLLDVVVVERDPSGSGTSLSPSCTSSKDVVDIRRTVSNGDLSAAVALSLAVGWSAMSPLASPKVESRSIEFERGDWSARGMGLEKRGVWCDAVDSGRSVNDRIEADMWDVCDWGRDEVSGASSKLSYEVVE